ncbi:MAG: Stk1 family PASTA domain-containing Ser/Thr kinase [Ruminococcaceae bacterium]|nr:Stk1 family PASTA domain-containing Ser/Thr kinase [Oscillospiraceae bacterium]
MIGKILGGRYEIIEEVGKGGMAVVYKAKCLLLNRIVAVKVLKSDFEESEEFLKRFNTEAQAAASLSNQNIVSIYDVGEENGVHYIVMEYIEGLTLKDYIKRMGKLPWQESVKIAIEICNGLSAAHANNIIHRDIKPQNIIVTNAGAIKVADFGIARAASSSTMTADNDVLGSVYYFSPEQARGGFVDKKTDIYSLGVVLYEMLTGNVPYNGNSPVAVAMKHIEGTPSSICTAEPNVPKNIENIVFKAMEKDTLKRYQTIDEMQRDLIESLSVPTEREMEETQKVPVAVPTKTTEKNVDEPKESDGGDKKAIIFAIITSLVLVSVFAFLLITGLNNGGKTFKMIDFVDLSMEEALEKALDEGFLEENIKFVEELSDGEENIVLRQKPSANQVVTDDIEDAVITFYISKKKITTYELENYVNKDYEVVKKELEKVGIKVEIEYKESDEYDEDRIISQYPKAGEIINIERDKVLLEVSRKSADDELVLIPSDIIGKDELDAVDILEELGLEVETKEKESDKEKGTVVEYTPDRREVKKGSKITLYISKGKAEEDDNPPKLPERPQNPDNSNKTTKTLSIDISNYTSTVTIRIESGGKVVHESTHDPSKTPMFSATLSGSGVVSFDIYINGQKVGRRDINFNN